jgi:hypothetical protein
MSIAQAEFVLVSMLLAGLLSAGGASAADKAPPAKVNSKQAGFYVQINPRKDSGHPWHGPGDLFVLGGKMVTHFPEAPGAVLCIVTLSGEASCPGQREGAAQPAAAASAAPKRSASAPEGGKSPMPGLGKLPVVMGKKPQSPCPSAYNCEFDEIKLPDEDMFGLVVIDPAMTVINLVDAVVVTRTRRTKKDPEVRAFDEQLREAVNKLAPPGPFEVKRRLRQFEVRTLNECSKGCKFSQSEITIDLD